MKAALCTVLAGATLLVVPAALAQQTAVTVAPVSVVPHLIKYSGALPSAPSKAEVVDVKFSLYAAQTGGEALWSETQQVSLDAAGKYSVVLGSVTALPDSVFANGQARWIGVTLGAEQESARTILVATPYSLKASDAETLGGHPVSDFTLKSALPAGGTNITQINVGNGITGGGTGPTVTLGLSNSYLASLGNEVYAQLTANNSLTGTNAFGAGKVSIGGSPALSVATVKSGNGITVSPSGTTAVSIALNESTLLSLGNTVYAQLGAANTFTKGQTFKAAVTFASGQTFPGTVSLSGNNTFSGSNTFSKAIAFASGQTFPGTVSLSGNNTFSGSNTFSKAITFASGQSFPGTGTITGVTAGTGLTGGGSSGAVTLNVNAAALESTYNSIYAGLQTLDIFTRGATFQTSDDIAVNATSAGDYAVAGTSTLVGVLGYTKRVSETGLQYEAYFGGIGVQGDDSTVAGGGLLATADDGVGASIANNSPSGYTALDVESNNSGSLIFRALDVATGDSCYIDGGANLFCSGSTSVVHSLGDRKVKTYGVQSAENWIEDFGSGQLTAGSSHISLEPNFAATVNTAAEYHVFLTPRGDSEGLYVAHAGPDGFDVKESRGGHSTLAFDYRIVAKRKGYETVRMEDITAKMNADKARRDKMHGAAPKHASLPAALAAGSPLTTHPK